MEKCIIIPDSFKGTMTSIEVCNAIEEEIKKIFPRCETINIPVADGGEGTVECFMHTLRGRKIELEVTGPFGDSVKSFYGVLDNGTAVIEMAAAAGLPMVYDRLDPLNASTYGVGELILHAVKSGCKRIILGLGGSCTNDGGTGMAAALGTVFIDAKGKRFVPSGGTLSKIHNIDNSETERLLANVTIEAMCDIDNPMFGKNGAAYVFGPQKGAGEDTVQLLDDNLRHLAEVMKNSFGFDVSRLPGSGAAGAMGAGVVAFLGGRLSSGIELILETVDFDELLSGCDMVFTGEGRLDSQSLSGKVISGVARHAKAKDVPVIAIAGCVEEGISEALEEAGIIKAWAVYEGPQDIKEIIKTCIPDLKARAAELMKTFKF